MHTSLLTHAHKYIHMRARACVCVHSYRGGIYTHMCVTTEREQVLVQTSDAVWIFIISYKQLLPNRVPLAPFRFSEMEAKHMFL